MILLTRQLYVRFWGGLVASQNLDQKVGWGWGGDQTPKAQVVSLSKAH